jgi:Carboxypeptidase regulatory-like domain/TonB dependent receptor
MQKRWGSLMLLALLCIPGIAFGQNFRGAVSGTVTDPKGAAIPGAKVTLTDLATRASLTTETDAEGLYSILYIPAGRHRLQVEARGFQAKILENVEVRVGDQLTLDLGLEVGQTTDAVTVRGDSTPLLESASASMGLVIDRQRIADLPLPDGNPLTLARFAAGVANTDVGNLRFTRPFDNGGTSNIATSGVVGGSEFTLDGIPNNQAAFSRQVAYVPPAEAVQEFKVVTTSFDAQQGHSAGAQIDVVLRSGANRPFGSLYWFNRNEALAGNEFFVNANPNCNKDEHGKCRRNPLRYNRYGATAGGPIVLPRFGTGGPTFWNGKDRLFFFFAFEGLRQVTPATNFFTVPTEAERNGDFSALLAQGITIYDPLTARPLPDGRVERQPIQCGGRINVICPDRISQIGKNYLSYYPLPNLPGDPQGRNNFVSPAPRTDSFHSESVRVDATISEKQQLFGRYSHNRRRQHVQSFSGVINGIDPTSTDTYRVNHGAAVDHIYRASPTTVLNVRAGFTRFENFGRLASEGEFNPASLGFPPETAAYFGDASYFPQFIISDDDTFSELGGPLFQFTGFDVYAFQPTLTRIKGGHTFRTGYDFRIYRANENPDRHAAGVYVFEADDVATRQFSNSPGAIGQDLAAVLLGLPSGGEIDRNASSSNQLLYHGLFFQDDWKVTKRLTLNLGLRWEMESPATERYNRNVRGFDFTAPSPIEADAREAYSMKPIPEVPVDAFRVTGGLLFATENNRGFYEADKNNFQPRIGFAFELAPKTVLRGGFAIYSVPFYVDGDNQPGFSQSTQIVPTLDGGLTFQATLANPFPNGVTDPPGASDGLSTFMGRNISFVPLERKNTQSRRYALSLQRELPGHVVAELAFVRTVNYDQLVEAVTLNPIPRQYLSTLNQRDTAVENFLNERVSNPFKGLLRGTNFNGDDIVRFQLLRPYPHFGSILIQRYDGRSIYNSGQLRLERRFANGFTLTGTYTYSKLIEEMSLLNQTDTNYERRISNDDYPHRVVISGVYELPVGKGRRFLSNGGRMLDLLVGGFQVQGIYQYQGGRPLNWEDPVAYFGALSELRTNINSDTVGMSGRVFDTSGFYFTDDEVRRADGTIDPAMQRSDERIQLGNNIRTFPTQLSGFRSHPISQIDLSLIKNFKFTERTRMQLRVEFYNATNTPQFGGPNLDPTSSNFGKVTNQVNLARNIQVGLRLTF